MTRNRRKTSRTPKVDARPQRVLRETITAAAPHATKESLATAFRELVDAASVYRNSQFILREGQLERESISTVRGELKKLKKLLADTLQFAEGLSHSTQEIYLAADVEACFHSHGRPFGGLISVIKAEIDRAARALLFAKNLPNRPNDDQATLLAYDVAIVLCNTLQLTPKKTQKNDQAKGTQAPYDRILRATAVLAGMKNPDTKRLMRKALELLANPRGDDNIRPRRARSRYAPIWVPHSLLV